MSVAIDIEQVPVEVEAVQVPNNMMSKELVRSTGNGVMVGLLTMCSVFITNGLNESKLMILAGNILFAFGAGLVGGCYSNVWSIWLEREPNMTDNIELVNPYQHAKAWLYGFFLGCMYSIPALILSLSGWKRGFNSAWSFFLGLLVCSMVTPALAGCRIRLNFIGKTMLLGVVVLFSIIGFEKVSVVIASL